MKCALRPLRWKKKQQNKQKILSPQGASFGTKVSSSFLFNCHQRPTVSLKNTGNSTVCSAHSRALLNTLLLKSNKVFFSNFLWKTPAFEGGVGIQQILFYCGFLAHLTLALKVNWGTLYDGALRLLLRVNLCWKYIWSWFILHLAPSSSSPSSGGGWKSSRSWCIAEWLRRASPSHRWHRTYGLISRKKRHYKYSITASTLS